VNVVKRSTLSANASAGTAKTLNAGK